MFGSGRTFIRGDKMSSTRKLGTIVRCSLLLVVGFLANVAFAVTLGTAHYVRAGATGAGSGTDWTNAYPSLPASLVRGDTYYVAAGSYGDLTLKDSGTTVTTILHPTTASHGTDTGWNDAYAGQAVWTSITFNQSDYVIDGATGGGPGSWGTGFGFKVQMPTSSGQSHAIGYGGSGTMSNITLRHIDIQGRGRAYTGGDTDLIYLLSPYSNFTISYSYLHDTDRTMMLTWPSSGTGMTIEYSYFARNGVAEHREAWSLGPDSNVIVRYNIFEDIFGTGVLAAVNNTGTASNWQVYGNVMYWTGNYTDGIINTGLIVMGCAPPSFCNQASGWQFYNNDIVNLVGGSFTAALELEGTTTNVVCEDNIWYKNNTSSGPGPTGCGQATTADYNWFYGNSQNSTRGSHDVVGTANPFVNWQGGDWHLTTEIPGLIMAAPDIADALGNGLGTDGIWDRGAYQGTSVSATKPAPPQALTASVQ